MLSVEEWTSGMDARQLRACLVRLDEDIATLRAQNAELVAALKETQRRALALQRRALALGYTGLANFIDAALAAAGQP